MDVKKVHRTAIDLDRLKDIRFDFDYSKDVQLNVQKVHPMVSDLDCLKDVRMDV